MSASVGSLGILAPILLAAGMSHAAVSAAPAGQVTLQIRIVSQPLDEALQEFSRQSGIQVVFFSHVTDGIHSPGADGTYTVDEALRTLLTGSGLAFRIINSRTVEIYRPARPLSIGCCDE